MRRYLFAVLTSLALLAALPAVSLADSHHRGHHRRGERHHRHHDRIRHFRAHDNMANQDAGTVQSFTNDVLTIKLNDGTTTVSGKITPDTEVECEAMDQDFVRQDGGPGPSGRDDNGDNGDRGDQGDRGDDRGDRGDQGDDRGDRGDDNDNQNCLTALQTAGTKVRDATLKVTGAGAIWDRVDLDA